jgi:hypothetical protein
LKYAEHNDAQNRDHRHGKFDSSVFFLPGVREGMKADPDNPADQAGATRTDEAVA